MKLNQLIPFLMSSDNEVSIVDPYWNSTILLMRLDGDTNSQGLPFHRDYSRYQYHTRYRHGTSNITQSYIRTEKNDNLSGLPSIPLTSSTDIKSYTYLSNTSNRNIAISDLNADIVSQSNPSFLDVKLNGNPSFALNDDDFTLEISFFVDTVNLPWKYQTIYSVGNTLYKNWAQNDKVTSNNVATYFTLNSGFSDTGYGLFIEEDNLLFFAAGIKFYFNTPIIRNTWYHVAVQRKDTNLKGYINGVKDFETPFTSSINLAYSDNSNGKADASITIGACKTYSSFNARYQITGNRVLTSFSGGLSNLRITKAARYSSDFYTLYLPHPINPVSNKIDAYYSDVLYYSPFTYDYYDYSVNGAHIKDRNLLKQIPLLDSHSLHLSGTTYKTKDIQKVLDSNEWCLEFSLVPYVNNSPLDLLPISYISTGSTYLNETAESTWQEFLFTKLRMFNAYGDGMDEVIPLIRITTSDGKKILDTDMRIVAASNFNSLCYGSYFSTKISQDGDAWVVLPSETDIAISVQPSRTLPDEEIKYAGSFYTSNIPMPDIELSAAPIIGAYSENRYSIAIQKLGNSIYFFINGVLNKTVSISGNLYSGSNLELWLGGDYDSIKGKSYIYELNAEGEYEGRDITTAFTVGLSNIRLTNKARYSISANNDVNYINSGQPLALSATAKSPSRARIIDIIRKFPNKNISTESASWLVIVNQDLDGLDLQDFTLTQLQGISGASFTSLTKISNTVYELVADVGTGNGILIPNFNDTQSVFYPNSTVPISYYIGELSIEGEEYNINKVRPGAVLRSGSNAYINSKFLVELEFDGPIATFVETNIGIENALITKILSIDDISNKYELEITPLKEGVITIKALEGTAISDTGLLSLASNSLVRVYKEYFPIIQMPLNIGEGFTDISPSALDIVEVIPSNTIFSTTQYPLGESTSLEVNPNLEQGGLYFDEYDTVASLKNIDPNSDWTLEFFLRINSTVSGTSRRAHIFSIENSQGLSITATNGKLVIGRNTQQSSNLFPTVEWKDRVTSSYEEWDGQVSIQDKFPHFALTKKNDVYRFYLNGKRIGIVQSSTLFNITRGKLRIGYNPVMVNDLPYLISNLRLTYGKALYTAHTINIPYPPYEVIPNVSDVAEVINYISIYSNNSINSNVAKTGDIVTLKAVSIVPLTLSPILKLNNTEVLLSKISPTEYQSEYLVDDLSQEGNISIELKVPSQSGIAEKIFTKTTNNSSVVIDNEQMTVSLYSTDASTSHVFDVDVEFSETPYEFLLSDVITVNCNISNLYKYPNTDRYRFTVTAENSGLVSINIPVGAVLDLAGKPNAPSAIFTRNVIVPSYIPDPYWNFVTLLLQPSSTISDLSLGQKNIVNTNVVISNDTAPAGMSKSMYFDGSSSLQINSDSLSSVEPYTIELFMYIKSSTKIRLPKPNIQPPSKLTTNSFRVNWDSLPNRDYFVDIATDATFSNIVGNYKNINVGNSSFVDIGSNNNYKAPTIKAVNWISNSSFLLEWSKSDNTEAFFVDIALDSSFQRYLHAYNGKAVNSNYLIVGDGIDLEKTVTTINVNNNVISNVPSDNGSVITGILKDGDNYPQLNYFLDESSIRFYKDTSYQSPAIAEDMELFKWSHVALVNNTRFTYLYVDGEIVDKVKNAEFGSSLIIGHNIGFFNGYLTGIRITKNIARYSGDSYKIPSLPYPTN